MARLAEFVARRDIGHAFAEAEVLEPRRLVDMEVIDGMQVVMEAGFGHLFGAKTAAVVEYSLANSVIPYRHGGLRLVAMAAEEDPTGDPSGENCGPRLFLTRPHLGSEQALGSRASCI